MIARTLAFLLAAQAEASAPPPCPVAATVFARAAKSAELEAFARSKGYAVENARAEFGDVRVFTAVVPDTPEPGEALSELGAGGSLARIAAFDERGGEVVDSTAREDGDCYALVSRDNEDLMPRAVMFELGRAGADVALVAAKRLSLATVAFRGEDTLMIRFDWKQGPGWSLAYRARRGDFGPISSIALNFPPDQFRAGAGVYPDQGRP